MKDTLRNREILEKLKSLQDDLYNEHHDIKDMITEIGGNGLQVRELKNEAELNLQCWEVVTTLIALKEGLTT